MCTTRPVLCQIFKLMKMDSYRRFVRSPLYQNCTLASVEGKLLPQLSNDPVHVESWEEVPTFTDMKVKARKCIELQGNGKLCDYGFCFFLNSSSNNITVSNRTRSPTLTACQGAKKSSETKEDPGEVAHVLQKD